MGEPSYFVQFPHPGGQHLPPTDEMPWNTGDHKRKFLRSRGRYLDGDVVREDELVFWGEWEPQSRVVRRWSASDGLPRALHEPCWTPLAGQGFRQNTDPWIWGDTMLYSCCKQIVGPARSATWLQRLTRGSVICFGSSVAGRFCLDTVFVVASAAPWTAGDLDGLEADEAFLACTADPVARSRDRDVPLTLYRAATYGAPVDGMFSFIPARHAADPDPRFERPPIALPGMVNPASRQAPSGSRQPLDAATIAEAWQAVLAQVTSVDLLAAVSLEVPPRRGRNIVAHGSDRLRC
jgi:hypothetical protein